MATPINLEQVDSMPVVARLEDFDPSSGNRLERIIFNHRPWIIAFCVMTSLVLALFGTRLVVNASFEKLIPQSHPYIKNYLAHKDEIRGLGNSIRVVVENTSGGDIFDKEYLEVLREVNDTLVLTPGVFRPFVKSLWMPGVRWTEVTEEGFRGGPVMPGTYNGSPAAIDELRLNVARAGLVGTLVANDFKSSMIVAPMLERYADTGQRIDYGSLGRLLEDNIRSKELAKNLEAKANGKVKIHIIGFGKLVGDLIAGLVQVMLYFAIAAVVAVAIIYGYTRCVRSTVLVVACSLVAVVWQLGLVNLLGFELDPYSVLVPFLVFAIGVSHGAQKMNGIMQDVARGTHKYVAARYTFRRLFLAGLTALIADVVGFAVLGLIDIPVIKELGATASIGVGVLVFTNLVMLPVLLSYFGVSLQAAQRSLREDQIEGRGAGLGAVWNLLDRFTERNWAAGAVAAAALLGVFGYVVSLNLQVGDLDSGAPELRPDSRYNQDNAYITSHYGLSSDQFAVIVKTPPGGCEKYETVVEVDRLGWALRQVPGVQTTQSVADALPRVTSGFFEGSPKWITINHSQALVNTAIFRVQDNSPDLLNPDCSIMPVVAYLADHKAATLDRVLKAVEAFAAEHNSDHIQFLPVAGSAGIDAVTNIVVQQASRTMMFYVYGAVIVLCYITFRSVRAVIVAVLPLVVTSILCEALMVVLGIGMKVSSLPVIALGVGIGVDYALYLMSIQLGYMRAGMSLTEAYRKAVQFTGKVVALVGATLAAGVVTWAWSPIKFQADMGILLTFMFIWNMVGALILIPALSRFLLGDSLARNR
ncbi:MAG: MMPL family transporter [Rhodocyclaceae bacterium]|jgi:predicted RND superfamily exporter protein|nr:MMPL family transporter [Rhodocyclaceae bacterium]